MPNPNVIVDGISQLSPAVHPQAARGGQPPAGVTRVQFHGGRSGLLNMGNPRSAVWVEVLDSLWQANEPAFVEIDPRTNEITRLLCPVTVHVEALRPAPTGDVEVDLLISQARHYLKRANPDFPQLLNTLQT